MSITSFSFFWGGRFSLTSSGLGFTLSSVNIFSNGTDRSPDLSLLESPLFSGYCRKSRARSTRKVTQEREGSMESLLTVNYRESRNVGHPGWPDSWIQSRTFISSLNYKWYLASVVLLWTCLNNCLLVRFLALKPRIIASRSSWVQHMSVRRVITTDRMRKFNFWEHRYKIAPLIRTLTIL